VERLSHPQPNSGVRQRWRRLLVIRRMNTETEKTTTARLLTCFIRHADEKGSIDQKNEQFFRELNQLFANGNLLEQHLYELNDAGLIYYEEFGEDGFAPYIYVGCTKKTGEHLAALLQEIERELISLRGRISEILTFDPDRLRKEISGAEAQLMEVRKSAEANELLKPLLRQISEIEKHFRGVSVVAKKYEDVYKNIIRPVQLEGESGIKATVRWAVISIVASTAISVALGNWKELIELLK
jgi:hypothetical protein